MAAHLTPEQLAQAITLQRQCWTQERIAQELGVHRLRVSRALSRVNRKAHQRLEKRATEIKARQVAQLEWIAEQAIRGWERSQEDAVTVKETEGGQDGGKTERTTKGQAGTAAFLAEARAALADVRKVLGLDEAESIRQEVIVRRADRGLVSPASEPDEGPG